jgi:hypothetical protein
MNHLFGPGQPAEVAVDDNAVEAMIYKNEQAAPAIPQAIVAGRGELKNQASSVRL